MQFTKTLEALEVAENEIRNLRRTLEGLETIMRAEWYEVETVSRYRREIVEMIEVIGGMLAKREKIMLERMREPQP